MRYLNKIYISVSQFLKATCILLLFQSTLSGIASAQQSYTIDAQKVVGPNTRFWQALGHDFLFQLVNEPDGQELLDRMQEHQSCTYFRTHYTFSNNTGRDKLAGGSICGRVLVYDEQGNPHYDFSVVNKTFQEYVKRGMKPIVEFDFFPDRMARDFKSGPNDEDFASKEGVPKDWQAWEELLHRFMQNLVDTFGIDELRTWYFEVWNEPDGWPQEHMDVFFRLYDVFAHTVKSYDTEFKVGGPACYHIYFLRDFLDHVVKGQNFVTGKTGSPIDFVSYHLYGLSGSWLPKAPHIVPTVQRFNLELLWIQRLLNSYNLADHVEFHLNEWGQSSHFQKNSKNFPDLQYRDDERAALFMTKLVDCLYALQDEHNFTTKLMGYWGFCWEAKQDELFIGNRELTTAGNIPKPILTAYEMLAKLGEQRLAITGPKAGDRPGVLATKTDNNQIQILVYNFNETDDDLTLTDNVQLKIENLSGKRIDFEIYKLDREHHNTYRAWEKLGRPKNVDESIQKALMQSSKLDVNESLSLTIVDGKAKMDIQLPRHSMQLLMGTVR